MPVRIRKQTHWVFDLTPMIDCVFLLLIFFCVHSIRIYAPAWRDATRWFGVLVDLQLVAGLLRGDERALAAWPELSANADVGARAEVLRSAGCAPLAALPQDGGASTLTAAWLAEWRRRLPPGARRDRALSAPAEWLVPRLRDETAERAAAAEPVRRALVKLFRHHAFSPVAVYAHLALVALDVERLRGGVAVRSLAGPPAAGERA